MLEQNKATEANAPAASIIETSSQGFRVDVIAQSARQPVLVDFWAPWCEPCKTLTPALEKLVKSTGGKVRLAKMNIEQYPEIAGQLGIQSIPAVIAFQKGQPIDGFMGALPESQIKSFLERLIGPIGGEFEELVKEADTALSAGDNERAVELFSEAHATDPDDIKAIAGLARALVATGDLENAEEILLSAANAKDAGGVLAAARSALDVAQQAANVGDFAELEKKIADDPKDYQSRFDLALALNAAGKRNEAADSLMEIIRRDRTWNDGAARKQLLQLFEVWGLMEPETLAARRKLSVVLFS
jgi:putative thioredoxin